MNKKIIVNILIILIAILSGCNNQQVKKQSTPSNVEEDKKQAVSNTSQIKNDISETSEQITDDKSKTEPNDDYSIYKGKWICSEDSKTSDMVMQNGGQIIDIQEINGTHIKGNIMSIQKPPANRIASTDFQGTISNNTLNYPFDDDGFYNKGTFSITFEKDKLSVNIVITSTIDERNRSGWSLGSGNFVFVKEN